MTNDALISRAIAVTASNAMLTAVDEIEWLHSRAGITGGDCGAIKLLRTSIDEITDALVTLPTVPATTTHFDTVMDSVTKALGDVNQMPCVVCQETGDTMPCIKCDKFICSDHADGSGFCAECAPATTTTCMMADCLEPPTHFCVEHVLDVHCPRPATTTSAIEESEMSNELTIANYIGTDECSGCSNGKLTEVLNVTEELMYCQECINKAFTEHWGGSVATGEAMKEKD